MATTHNKDKFGTQYRGTSASDITDAGASVIEKGKDAAADAWEKGKEMAGNAASSVKDSASDAASYVGKKAEGATHAVGEGMRSVAGTIRDQAPKQGMLGGAAGTVADTLESGGRYLEEHGLSGIGDDLTGMIRRNPVPAVLIGIGVGFLIARATRS